MSKPGNGDQITVGDISHAQGVAVGRGARAHVRGSIISDAAKEVDAEAMRAALRELHAALGQANLPADTAIAAQTAAGTALIQGVKDGEVQPEPVVTQVQQIGETLKR